MNIINNSTCFFRIDYIACFLVFFTSSIFAETFEELKAKADKGDANAQFEIGRRYDSGEGVTKDMHKAVIWFRKAAEQGNAIAQNDLGMAYEYGDGIDKNHEMAFLWTKKSADQGYATAMNNLAFMYKNGTGVPKNPKKAFELWHKAAELGDSTAQNNLAFSYREGWGVAANQEKAFEWWKKAADSDHIGSCDIVANALEEGLGVEKNQNEAKEWKTKAFKLLLKNAEKGDLESQFQIALRYRRGEGTDKNLDLAFEWMKKSAEGGYLKAQAELGSMYTKLYAWTLLGSDKYINFDESQKWLLKAAGSGSPDAARALAVKYRFGNDGLEKNIEEALKWYRLEAKNGGPEVQYALGLSFLNGEEVIGGEPIPKDATEAFKWFRLAAEENHILSQLQLGICYNEGIGVKKDETEAANWYRKAAEQGDAVAQFNLGVCYAKGEGVPKDQSEAVNWYRKAAVQGVADAQFNLGAVYIIGKGVPTDTVEAVKWFRKAADQDHNNAQLNLGLCYLNGDGVSQNTNEAIRWIQKSADEGNENAKKNLEQDLRNNSQTKLALLISNSQYTQFGRLALTESDARSLANVLGSLGFKVYLVKNASREQMLQALKGFEEKLRGKNALAFFHYGGHGVQVGGKNYLIPADAEIPDELRVATRAVDLDEVIAVIESAKPKASVLVVDACRHNPLPATPTRSATRGLAVVGRKPKNSVIIFAAEAGNEAVDGLFTPVFAKILAANRDKSLNQVMQKVRSEVFNRSNGSQTPGEYNQLFEDVYLSPQN